MKKLRLHYSIIIVLFITSSGYSSLSRKFCGGDGPLPFTKVNNTFFEFKEEKNSLSIKDFIFLENTKTMIARTESHELWLFPFDSNDTKFLNYSNLPISKIYDPDERYIMTNEGGWLLDLKNSQHWSKLVVYKKPLEPIYWMSQKLYLMNVTTNTFSKNLNIFIYNPSKSLIHRKCSIKHKYSKNLRLMKGGEYPYAGLYDFKIGNKNVITFFKLNIETCALKTVGSYTEAFDGKIIDSMFFESNYFWIIGEPDKVIIKFNKDDCSYFQYEGESAFFLNNFSPIIMETTIKKGFSVMNVSEKLKAQIPIDSIERLTPYNTWLSQNKILLLAPKFESSGQRKLLSINIESLF